MTKYNFAKEGKNPPIVEELGGFVIWWLTRSKPSLSDESDTETDKYLRIFGNSENASIYVHYFNHGLNKCTYI